MLRVVFEIWKWQPFKTTTKKPDQWYCAISIGIRGQTWDWILKSPKSVAKYAYVFRNTLNFCLFCVYCLVGYGISFFQTYEVQATNIENHSIIFPSYGGPSYTFLSYLNSCKNIYRFHFILTNVYTNVNPQM